MVVPAVTAAQRECQHDQVGLELPALIRDVHTSLAAGQEVAELLTIVVLTRLSPCGSGCRETATREVAGRYRRRLLV